MAIRKRQSALRKSSSERKPWEDEVLRTVYAVRDAYAAEHDYDLDRIYADLKRREEVSRLRRITELPLGHLNANGLKSRRNKQVPKQKFRMKSLKTRLKQHKQE